MVSAKNNFCYYILHFTNGNYSKPHWTPFNRKVPFIDFSRDWGKEIIAVYFVSPKN